MSRLAASRRAPAFGAGQAAEGVGFEPTEARRTSTAFEAVPFVHSGILPGGHASGLSWLPGERRRTRRAGGRPRRRSTPAVTGIRWLRRGSAARFIRLPTAPAFGSAAPKTSRPTRALTIAPAHIGQGSSVTTIVQSSSRQWPTAAAASRTARISAWAVGSPVSSRSLCRAAITSPSRTTIGADRDVVVGERPPRLGDGALHRHLVAHGVHRGGSGIRTHGGLPHTRFPSVPIRPLSHPSETALRVPARGAVAWLLADR